MSYLSQRKNAGHSNPEVVDFKHLKEYHEHIKHQVQYRDSSGDKVWGLVTGISRDVTGKEYLCINNPINRIRANEILAIRSTGKTWA